MRLQPKPFAGGKVIFAALMFLLAAKIPAATLTVQTNILGPTPDATYQMELHYFYYPQSIVTATNTWLGDNFDSVLLYGALLEAYVFMKGEADVVKMYQDRYDAAMALLKQYAEGKNRQDMYRTPQTRTPVK